MPKKRKAKKILGWREWVSLPKLGIKKIKAKIDTGARTSALHASNIAMVSAGKKKRIRFVIHPKQKNPHPEIIAEAPMMDHRKIKGSHGQVSERPVIQTTLELGKERWPIELTLVNRDLMGFRLLIGREAIKKRFVIDAEHSYLGRKKR